MSAARIAEASLLNNEGAIHYSHGKLVEAMTCFRAALESMIFLLNNPTTNTNLPHGPNTISSSTIASLPLSRLRMEAAACKWTTNSDTRFYDHPLVFDQVISQNQEAQLIFCGVVIFNMAIASQAKGDSFCLTKALQLYEASIDFFRRANYQGTMFASVVAACLNNKICIHFDQCQYDDLERDSARLSGAMTNADNSPVTKSIVGKDDFEGILLNILMLRRPMVAEAA